MSNWALLQEQLTGLPVAKRAKYGIHFQNGSEIEAHFVGKPCHFQENGIWKPIDTALLATADGGYSSPHSDVVIHPDGRVRVKGSDYQQFTKLPSAKAGKLVGDRVIREFPGGEQHLIMKEDGFREEIHVFKPTFKIEKFIAKTTGNLPSKYKAHPITAEDAEGNSYTFTGDVKAFGDWLDKAAYPVVIDPDFSGGKGDLYIRSDYTGSDSANTIYVGRDTSKNTYRGGVLFDTSSIGSDTVTQANLKLAANGDFSDNNFDVVIKKADWTGKNQYSFDLIKTADSDDSIWRNTSGINVNTQYTSGNLSTSWINKTGYTKYGLITSLDITGASYSGNEFLGISSANHATESYRPVLTVTYSAGGIPKHFMHYQRLRSL